MRLEWKARPGVGEGAGKRGSSGARGDDAGVEAG